MSLPEGIAIRKARQDEMDAIREMTVKELDMELDEFEARDKERIAKAGRAEAERFLKREGNEFYVAESDGVMAGYLWWGTSQKPFSGTSVGWVYDIQVVPAYRGRGIGEALMKHALQVSRERGLRQTGLMVNEKNRVAWSLYEKLGFRTDHRLMSRDEPGTVSASNS